MSKTKKLLVDAKKKMDGQQFKEALEDLEVAIMVDSNCYQGYLMAGLCYEKLENVEKAIENYELAHETKPEEALPNKQLYLIYKQEKEFQKAAEYVENIVDILEPKTDKVEQYSDYAMKLLEVYEYSMDIQKTYSFFLKVIERKDLKDKVKAEACRVYFKLVMEDHKLEFSHVSYIGENFQNTEENQVVDWILEEVFNYVKLRKQVKEKVQVVFEDLVNLKSSAVALEQQMSFYLYQASKNFKIVEKIVKNALEFIIANEYKNSFQGDEIAENLIKNSLYKNYQEKNEQVYERISLKCKMFINMYFYFLRSDSSEVQNVDLARKLIEDQKIDVADFPEHYSLGQIDEFQNYIVYFVFKIIQNINSKDFQQAKKQLDKLFEQIMKYKDSGDVSFLEDLHTKLGLSVFDDLDSLLQAKVICKQRLQFNMENLEMLKCYYDCAIKLIRNFKHYDPEISIVTVVDQILKLEPQNNFYKGEKIWLEFSGLDEKSQPEKYKEYIDKLENLVKVCKEKIVVAKQKKRIGTLKLIFEDQNNIDEVEQIWKESVELSPNDYQIYKCLGLISQFKGDIQECLQNYFNSFVIYQLDIQVNKNLFFALSQAEKQDEAVDFIDRIYNGFQKVFWVNYVLALHYSNCQDYSKAEKYISEAIMIHHLEENRIVKNYYEQISYINDESQYGLPYLLNQNDVLFYDDYPVLSDKFWNDKAVILSNQFTKKAFAIKNLFKLYIQQAQILRMKGMIGSSLRSITEAHKLLTLGYKQEKNTKNILAVIENCQSELGKRMFTVLELFEKAFLKQSMINSPYLDLQKVNIESVLLYMEFSQISFYAGDYFDAQQKIRYALILGIYLLENQEEFENYEPKQQEQIIQEVEELFSRILSIICEIGNQVVTKIMLQQNKFQAQQIYNQFSKIEVPTCDSFQDFIIISEYYLTGFLLTDDNEKIMLCLAHLESGFSMLDIEINDLKSDNLEKLQKINDQLNLMNQNGNEKDIQGAANLLADLIFANYKLYEKNKNEKKYYEQALDFAKVGIQLFQNMPQFYNYYGILIEDLGQKIGAFMEAIQIDSQNTIAIDNLAEQYLIHGKFEESVKLYLKSMEINPGNTRAYMGVIVICLIYGIDYIRNLNVNYINNLKKYPYYRAQTEFFIDKCRSYINFVQEFEANDLSMLISSALEFVEYNQVITKKLENFQLPNTIKQLKKSETGEDFLHILYNLQLTTLPDIVGNEQNNQMLTKFYQNNIQNGILKLSEEDNILMDKYFNGLSQNLEELYNIFAQKVQNENEILVQGIKSSCNISSFADFKDEATVEETQHYSLVYYMNQHLQNINLFLVLGNLCGVQDAQTIFKKMAFNISSTNCDILFKNCSRFFNVYQIQINICLNYYNYLCNIYQADKNEINDDIKQALIMYSNAKIQVQNMTDWVLCQLQDDLNEIDIYDFSDYYYLQGLHAQKQQDHRLVQKKLFGSLLMNPQQIKNREAYYSHQISVERKMVLTDASRYLNVNQYEKRLLNSINSEQLTLNQKISLLQKGCIYINKPNIWYLLVHFSLEDTNKYDKKFFLKMFLLLKQNVINKLNKDLNKVDRILKRGVKLLHEIFWKIKQLYPEEKKTLLEIKACIDENSQILPEGQDFNQKVEIYFKSGEQQINQLRQIIQQKPDFDTLKLLFEICRNLFVTQKGKNLIELLQEMRNLIINMEESLTTHKSKMKLYNMIQYIDGFIYIAAIQEQYDENREYDQVDILEIVAEASQNIVGYKEQSTNTIFLHLLYCYQNNLKEEMAQYLQILQYFPVIHNVKDDFLHNYFEVLQRYGKLIDKDETRIYDAIEDFLQFVELIQEQFYEQFNSSIKSLYYYMQGIAKLKMAEYEPETDRKSLTKNFKLSILYRPDLGSQIIKDFVQ